MEPTTNISGYRLYRGAGSPANIDYSMPIATAPAGEQGAAVTAPIPPLPDGWPTGTTWFIAVRAVDNSGVEFADPAAITRAEFDESGNLMLPRPAAVSHLRACPTSGQRLRISWRCHSDSTSPSPATFEIFLAQAEGSTLDQLLTGQPAAVAPAGSAGSSHTYSWASGQRAMGRWRIAVRGVSASGQPGPAQTAVASIRPNIAAGVKLLGSEVR